MEMAVVRPGWVAVVALLSCAVGVSAQPLPFYDGFEDGDFEGWTVVTDPEPQSGPADWSVRNGMLVQSSNIWSYEAVELETKYHLGTHVVTGDAGWADYSFNAVVRSTDNDGVGLIFRYQDSGNYYRVLLMNDPAWSGRDASGTPFNSPVRRIQKFEDGEPIILAEAKVDSAYPAGYFSLSVDVRSDSIRAFLNGEPILAASDDSYVSGGIGLLSYANTGAYYDSVSVTSEFQTYGRPDIRITYPVLEDRAPYIQRPTRTSVDVAWRSVQPAVGRVVFGGDKGALNREVIEPEPTRKHILSMTGLETSTRYYYEVYEGSRKVQAEESFSTARGHDEPAFSFFVLGDSGVDTPTQWDIGRQMLREMNRDEVDFIVHVGDVHQGSGDYYDDVYFKPYAELIKKLNVFTSLGNHDTYTDGGAVYLDDFYLPHNNPAQTERYYSFRWGNAYFICLDTNIDYGPASDQYKWLLGQLNSSERHDAMWTFVYAHHPPFSEYWTDYYGEQAVQEHLVPLFEKHQVDMVMNGHTHSYERGEKNHVHYLVTGGGGGGLDDFFVDYDHISFSAKTHHFTRIDVDDDQLEVSAIDQDGEVVDRFTIHKFANVAVTGTEIEPDSFSLGQNYPNPAANATSIPYELPVAMRVRIDLFDLTGQHVATLLERDQAAGSYEVDLDVDWLPAGTYSVRMAGGGYSKTRRITVLK